MLNRRAFLGTLAGAVTVSAVATPSPLNVTQAEENAILFKEIIEAAPQLVDQLSDMWLQGLDAGAFPRRRHSRRYAALLARTMT